MATETISWTQDVDKGDRDGEWIAKTETTLGPFKSLDEAEQALSDLIDELPKKRSKKSTRMLAPKALYRIQQDSTGLFIGKDGRWTNAGAYWRTDAELRQFINTGSPFTREAWAAGGSSVVKIVGVDVQKYPVQTWMSY